MQGSGGLAPTSGQPARQWWWHDFHSCKSGMFLWFSVLAKFCQSCCQLDLIILQEMEQNFLKVFDVLFHSSAAHFPQNSLKFLGGWG